MDPRSLQRPSASLPCVMQHVPSPSLIPVPFAGSCQARKNSQERLV